MATSNWQNIGYCIDAMMKINPSSILDVGAGFGRWGMLAREFCELWRERHFPSQWALRVDAVEAFADNISEYHHLFYNNIYVEDAAEFVSDEVCQRYDLIILGDVLEHLERKAGKDLLERCIANAKYVMVNIPLGPEWEQGEVYGNKFERHQAVWQPGDFQRPELRHHRLFRDYVGRPFGVFVLSREDACKLREGLCSCYEKTAEDMTELQQVAQIVENLRFELAAIYASRSWRLLHKIRTSLPGRVLRKVMRLARG